MNKDDVKGAGNKAKGSVKETVGKATGDHALHGEGLLTRRKALHNRLSGP